jgi:hypothetical protein
VPRREQDGQPGVGRRQALGERPAADHRHVHVGDDRLHREVAPAEQLERALPVLGFEHLKARLLERANPDCAYQRLILDHQDRGRGPDRTAGPAGRLRSSRALRQRDVHAHGGAGAELAFGDHVAAELAHDPVDAGEAETGALADRLGGEERLERAGQRLGAHAAVAGSAAIGRP